MPFYVEFVDTIAIWHLDNDRNQFNFDTVREMDRCLDEIEANPIVTCMISIGYGKSYSQGLDLLALSKMEEEAIRIALNNSFAVVVRVLTFPIPTIAAINGHCYGVGAFLAIAHDYKLMREDRGYFCFPEAKLASNFGLQALIEIIKHRVPITTQSIAVLSMPFTGPEACQYGLVQETSSLDELLMKAQDAAKRILGKNTLDRENLKIIKCSIYDSIVKADNKVIGRIYMDRLFAQTSKL